MRWSSAPTVLVGALLFCACGGVGTRPPAPAVTQVDPARDAARAELARDLEVVLSYTGSGEEDADADWPVTASLVNRGARARWIVRPDDGSGAGWREPHVFYTAEMEQAPGVWSALPPRDDFSRCSLYASAWRRDIAELAPGQSVGLDDLTDPSTAIAFPRSGRVRLYAHYAYDGGKRPSYEQGVVMRDAAEPPLTLPAGLDRGPFALVSAPIELRVHADTSLGLSISLRHPRVRVGERLSFAALLDASVENRESTAQDLGEDLIEQRFALESRDLDGRAGSWHPLDGPHRLDAHERASLGTSGHAPDLYWSEPGKVRLRIRYDAMLDRPMQSDATKHGSRLRRARSPWVELEVVP